MNQLSLPLPSQGLLEPQLLKGGLGVAVKVLAFNLQGRRFESHPGQLILESW